MVFLHPPIETSNEVFVHSLVELRQGPNGLTGSLLGEFAEAFGTGSSFWKRSLGVPKFLMVSLLDQFLSWKRNNKNHGEIGKKLKRR